MCIYIPGHKLHKMGWGGRIWSQGWYCNICSCMTPAFIPIVGTICPQTCGSWATKHHIAYHEQIYLANKLAAEIYPANKLVAQLYPANKLAAQIYQANKLVAQIYPANKLAAQLSKLLTTFLHTK